MGFWCGFVGVIGATIIDKRIGFWSAFWGMLVSGAAIAFIAIIVAFA